MDGEISRQTKAGKTKFYYPSGIDDDRSWTLALAVSAGSSSYAITESARLDPKPPIR